MVLKVQLSPLASPGACACSGLCNRGEAALLCPALQSWLPVWLCLAQTALWHMKVRIDKCEVSCIRRNNFKLLAHVAGCEINCSGKKNTSWHPYGYIIENICSLQSSGQKRKEISSPIQMISEFPGALGWIVFVGPSFLLGLRVWTQLTNNR